MQHPHVLTDGGVSLGRGRSRLQAFSAGCGLQIVIASPGRRRSGSKNVLGHFGVIVEYANQRGEPRWQEPSNSAWDYTIFGTQNPVPEPDQRLELLFEKVPGGRGGYNRWTLNGKSWPATDQLLTTEVGMRYRLIMTNKSGDNHPIDLYRHTFRVDKGRRQGNCGRDEGYDQHDPLQQRGNRICGR
jgi:hypothetical protein